MVIGKEIHVRVRIVVKVVRTVTDYSVISSISFAGQGHPAQDATKHSPYTDRVLFSPVETKCKSSRGAVRA